MKHITNLQIICSFHPTEALLPWLWDAKYEHLQTMVPRNRLTGDSFQVVAIKGNDKETAIAKKLHMLIVSLTIPSEIGISGTQEVYLSLTDLQGNALTTVDAVIAFQVENYKYLISTNF
ncbi:hypothetical protein Q0590_30620 [Rhodocytophaga aerolata]|uniref:Uncharacterized protein n=1 Tax=Rhodocytophaga aerolata TaxID=455078 RepID=A0ABT8REZ6_9BACT|nr:hypothetical protein [Rhodocytophaga aerolata]